MNTYPSLIMNTQLTSKKALMGAVGLTFLLLLTSGCEKKEVNGQENLVSLRSLPKSSGYASLSLVGTRWKLIGFADEKSRSVRLAVPFNDRSYTITFGEDGSITGYTSTNAADGRYHKEPTSFKIASFGPKTYMNEVFDGRPYIDAMSKVFAANISDRGLVLHYEKDKFLLFRIEQ